ncbi:MAG: hypothetical protein ABI885_03820 [Gammaproteobacteria bacterium]
MRRTWFGTGVLLVMITAASCALAASGFVVALPNGYEMIRDKADAPTIVKRSGSKVVPGPIAAYVVVRDVVTGQVMPTAGKPDKKARKPAASSEQPATTNGTPANDGDKPVGAPGEAAPKPTYFVLNTGTGDVALGLSQEDWAQRLKQLGVDTPPELNPPLLPGASPTVTK